MANFHTLTGKDLNKIWNVGARHARYHEDGNWYHQLTDFPGVLFDANGFVVFETEESYIESPYLQIKQDLHVPGGISSIPNYVRVSENSKLIELSNSQKRLHEKASSYNTNSQSGTTIPHGNEVVERKLTHFERIVRDTKVTLWVKQLHSYRCQICGTALDVGGNSHYAEAHHIKPLGSKHNGPDVVENVICVCPNHHALLDLGVLVLDIANLFIIEGHELNTEYVNYHNSEICMRQR